MSQESEVSRVVKVNDDVSNEDSEKNVSTIVAAHQKASIRWIRRRIFFFAGLMLLVLGLLAMIIALPIVLLRRGKDNGDERIGIGKSGPLLSAGHPSNSQPIMVMKNFPDPGLLKYNGTWYAFATNPRKSDPAVHPHVPMAVSSDFLHWTLLTQDALPVVSPWEKKTNHWAPDVLRRVSHLSDHRNVIVTKNTSVAG
jgi:hypothetical protein